MGIPMRVGTGLMEILQKPSKPAKVEPRKLMFDAKEFHLPEFTSRI